MVLAVCGIAAAAQTNLRTTGHSVQELVPEGWINIAEAQGDLNKDGIDDLVVVAAPSEDEWPVLGIYWGDKQGRFNIYQAYDSIMPHSEEEFSMVDLSIGITNIFSESYAYVYCFKTPQSYAYIKVVYNGRGIITTIQPFSTLGANDDVLNKLLETLHHLWQR